MKVFLCMPLLLLCLLFSAGTVEAQSGINLILSGGILDQINNEEGNNEEWNLGWNVAGQGFLRYRNALMFGLRASYDRISSDDTTLVSGLPATISGLSTEGTFSIIELVPSLRLTTDLPGLVNFFGQFGWGVFIKRFEADATGTVAGESFSLSAEDSDEKMGLVLGGGAILGRFSGFSIELSPLYHVIFDTGRNNQFYTVNMGINIGI